MESSSRTTRSVWSIPVTSAGTPASKVACAAATSHWMLCSGSPVAKSPPMMTSSWMRCCWVTASATLVNGATRLAPGGVAANSRHAARYLPWTRGADVGGDWYDVIPIRPGVAAVVIGDVAGHNAAAAATMG